MNQEFCVYCEAMTNQSPETYRASFQVRGEAVTVELPALRCSVCGEYNLARENDLAAQAYRVYRRRRNWMQPEEITALRKQCGLTQKEFSQALGMGIATLNRYENGALQSESHERLLRHYEQQAHASTQNSKSLLFEVLEKFAGYAPSQFSGFARFDFQKFTAAAQTFCTEQVVYKTKLMKLLFYSDFFHFKTYGVSITGARYAHLPYGPVPDYFATWLTAMTEWEEVLTLEERYIDQSGYIGEVLQSRLAVPDVFNPAEIATLQFVQERFRAFSVKAISDYSHAERGYQETSTGALISYNFTESLQI